MSDNRTPGAAGQSTDPPALPDVSTIVEELRALRRNAEQRFLDFQSAIAELEAKLHAIALDPHGEHASVSPAVRLKPPPALAYRSDGRVLLSIAHVGKGVDISAREHWVGVVLTEAEQGDVQARVSEACDEAAGNLVGRMRGQDAQPEADPDLGGSS
jgi:hypothetical protein